MEWTKLVLISHNDADGAGSPVLAKAALGSACEYRCVKVNEGSAAARRAMESEPPETMIVVADLSVDEEAAELMDKRGNAALLDHHKTALWLNRYAWAKVDASKCATSHFFDWLSERGFAEKLRPYAEFAALVNDYDLWIHSDARSRELDRLFWLVGIERFIARFSKNPSVALSPEEKFLLELDDERCRKYFSEYTEENVFVDGKFGYAFGESYISELGHHLLEKFDLDAVALINPRSKKVSLRSRPGFDASAYAKRMGGGGHEQSCSYPLAHEKWMDIIASAKPAPN